MPTPTYTEKPRKSSRRARLVRGVNRQSLAPTAVRGSGCGQGHAIRCGRRSPSRKVRAELRAAAPATHWASRISGDGVCWPAWAAPAIAEAQGRGRALLPQGAGGPASPTPLPDPLLAGREHLQGVFLQELGPGPGGEGTPDAGLGSAYSAPTQGWTHQPPGRPRSQGTYGRQPPSGKLAHEADRPARRAGAGEGFLRGTEPHPRIPRTSGSPTKKPAGLFPLSPAAGKVLLKGKSKLHRKSVRLGRCVGGGGGGVA